LRPTYWPTSNRYGGTNGTIDESSEVAALRQYLDGRSVTTGDADWWAVEPSERVFIRDTGDPTDVQQMCREGFALDRDGYDDFCLHQETEDGEPRATTAAVFSEEVYWCLQHLTRCPAYYEDAAEANRLEGSLFTGNRKAADSTRSNAFRHAFWVALMVNSFEQDPDLALEYATAHEDHDYVYGASNPSWSIVRRSQMDVINDRVGHKIAVSIQSQSGSNPLTDESACRWVFARVRDHDIKFNYPDVLEPLDEYENRGHIPAYYYPVYLKNQDGNGVTTTPLDIDTCADAND
jgi:hypothetical protein